MKVPGIERPDMNVPAGFDTIGGTADTTSYGIGIDHTIGALSFGIGYGSKTVSDNAYDGMSTVDYFLPLILLQVKQTWLPMGGTACRTTGGRRFVLSAEAGDIDMDSLVFPGDIVDTKDTIISAGMSYDLGGGVTVSAGIHSGKRKNVAGAAGDRPMCVPLHNAADRDGSRWQLLDRRAGQCRPLAIMLALTLRWLNEAPALRLVSNGDAGHRTRHSYPVSHTVSYAVTDLDDVGVGLRIAFSF